MDLAQMIKMARGIEPAEILLRNGRVVNVYTGEIYPADIAMAHSRIVGIGPGFAAAETYDLEGRYVCPGFIDAHVHIESAMVPPHEFARAVVPRGTTTAVIDPHDIERAQRRAELLQKAGYQAIPVATGPQVTLAAEAEARAQGVAILQDGRSLLWEEALARWLNRSRS